MSKHFSLLAVVLIVFTIVASAQKNQSFERPDSSFEVEPNIVLNTIIPHADQYYYDSFRNGQVIYRDGRAGESRLNYNSLTDEMHFINTRGDTLALAQEPTIRFIAVGKDTFFYQQGYIRLVASVRDIKFGIKQGFRVVDKKKDGGYDILSSASSSMSFTSFYDERMMYGLKVREQILIKKFRQYYFGDKYNSFVIASEKAMSELFPGCITLIRKFYKNNKIRFERTEDLEKVIAFIDKACME